MIIRWRDEVILSASQKHFSVGNLYHYRWQFFVFIGLLLVAFSAGAVSTTRIAVLYPESKSQAGKLYASIIEGMSRKGVELHQRSLAKDASVAEVQDWLEKQNCQVAIFLGKRGLRFSEQLKLNIPVVTGAHVGVRSTHSSVTLAADPQQLFQTLMQMQPAIRRVSVIYNRKNSGWLIALAQSAAKKSGVQLNAIESDSMRASAAALKQVIKQAEVGRDAVWLVFDPIVPVKALLPDLLKAAWQKRLAVFSGNPYHVQQGALFALYPKYPPLGRQLVDLALLDLKKSAPVRHQASQSLNRAINMRTAAHIGARTKDLDASLFNLIVPARP